MEACLLDVSPGGARLRIPEQIAVGSHVRVDGQALLLFGVVRRCLPINGAHEVGLELSVPLEVLGQLQKLNAAFTQFS